MKQTSHVKTPQFKTLREYVDAQPRTMSQSDIAADIGISPSLLSEVLNGKKLPSRDTALLIKKKTGVSLDVLLDPAQVSA